MSLHQSPLAVRVYAHNLPQSNWINDGIVHPLRADLATLNRTVDPDTDLNLTANSDTNSDTGSDTDSSNTAFSTLSDSDNFWGLSNGKAIIIATAIMDATESQYPHIYSRSSFWDTIRSAWAIVGCHGHASLITRIRTNKLGADDLTHLFNDINDNMPLMLHVLESRLDHYAADALSAWNGIAQGMFDRMDIDPVREVLAGNDTEWSLARAWVIAAGLDVYIALTAKPDMFEAFRGAHCHKIIELAPEMYERKFGASIEAFTQ
ncbi:hypothetical protein CcaverHIS002_0510950 [Cutaneotrichosporon cavernicola]|uniref:Uncharacterized protein n=1 Tax=Cutaneotrichosporon cavernicola TaxID=279322 RepID=A0AA48L7R9_9TREE|nr:uncharacterized protein CcaverHIS019_0511500 [Cutaneotrichosporon cavernicola]BEI85694.1 hypothetical protein CcaverHIS002_0510950 [Cutaneotrichosporon cavernicola]BEI93522.1 hypothetical protein CcaverHIS019_0511500 [Cutaneotrichosporon cavernicola]BEJ01302.1 hypothetical protein CcaverHIS631_0511590 [Cutaneotrichosporon cavernicola]BEJ09068.1 hypothetical protein CcaverHIS641_0511620 [Cutaneotrichosporon cavernicola]